MMFTKGTFQSNKSRTSIIVIQETVSNSCALLKWVTLMCNDSPPLSFIGVLKFLLTTTILIWRAHKKRRKHAFTLGPKRAGGKRSMNKLRCGDKWESAWLLEYLQKFEKVTLTFMPIYSFSVGVLDFYPPTTVTLKLLIAGNKKKISFLSLDITESAGMKFVEWVKV